MVGSEFAGYRIERLLGEGGFSSVYLAEDLSPHLQRMVALKVLRPHLAEDEAFRERFLRESRAAAALNHPNIVAVFSAGELEGRLYIAMQYVDGPDLGTLIAQRGPMTVGATARTLGGVAAALDAAHHAGVVHRDVKPGNILLRSDFEHAYLTDFGLVKRTSSEDSLTSAGDFLGTLSYAAPEQIEGRPVSARTDTYSLGCVLYECLTGLPPYNDVTGVAILTAHLTRPAPQATAARPGLPDAVDDLITWAMQKDASLRPTCGELAATLSTLPTGETVVTARREPARETIHSPRPAPGGPIGGGPGPVGPQAGGPRAGGSERSGAERSGGGRKLALIGGIALALIAMAAVAVVLLTRSGSDAFPNEDERSLLRNVPASFRETCEREASTSEGATAAVRCIPSGAGADTVAYTSFASRRAMTDAFEGARTAAGVDADSGDCAEHTGVESTFLTADNLVGRVLCYRAGGDSHIMWSMGELRIVAAATREDRQDAQLYDWWAELLGVEPPPPVDPVEELLLRVPEAIRGTCEAITSGLAETITAAVDCFPPDGAQEARYLLFGSRRDMVNVYEFEVGRSGVTRNTGSCDSDITAEGSYSIGGEPDRGRVFCFRAAADHPEYREGSWIVWTHFDLLILSSGWRPDTSDLRLFEWWRDDAGPT